MRLPPPEPPDGVVGEDDLPGSRTFMSWLRTSSRAVCSAAHRPLLAKSPALLPALASPLRTRGYHGGQRNMMGYEPWMGQQAHATTILSVRKDDKVVRGLAHLSLVCDVLCYTAPELKYLLRVAPCARSFSSATARFRLAIR